MLSDRNLSANQLLQYYNWKINNKYYKKQFSILGDSISTLEGYNPKGYRVFFKDEMCKKSNIKEMKDTWWGKVIEFFGGELLVNNSWSGSRVTKLSNRKELFPSGCSNERTNGLHINHVKPDVIIIYLGTNDWAFGALLNREGTDGAISVDFYCESFKQAYSLMIEQLKNNYPEAELWCCTLNSTFMSTNSRFVFPKIYNGNDIEQYNDTIKECARKYGCRTIDLYSYKMPYDSIDGSHPNSDGMNTLADLMIRSMCSDVY